MAVRKRRGDATKDLRRLAKYFRVEMAIRRWGQHEFDKLVAESVAAGEKVDEAEREAVRRVLAMIDRTASIKIGALCAIEIIEKGTGGAIPLSIVRDVIAVFEEQAGHAVSDAFAALRAAAREQPRRGRLSFGKEAVRLAALRPSLADLKASLAAIEAITPRRKSRLSPFSRSLQDALAAAAFTERAVARVERLVADGARGLRRVGRAPLVDVMHFVARCAGFVEGVVTERIAQTGEKARRRGPTRSMRTRASS